MYYIKFYILYLIFFILRLLFIISIIYRNNKGIYSITMPIITNLDVMLAKRKMSLTELSKAIEMSLTNLSLLKTGNVRGVRYQTLEKICIVLDCQPGDILEYRSDDNGFGLNE